MDFNGFPISEIFDVKREKKSMTTVQYLVGEPEIKERTVVICLSSERYIRAVTNSLHKKFQDWEVKVRGNEITVFGDSATEDFSENNVLAIVQKHDRHAKRP